MIEINSEETPILDGSSAPFTAILLKAGIVEQDAIRIVYNVNKKVYLKDNDKDVEMWLCLLYTSDAADDLLCVDLGGRRIIKKKTIILTIS